MKNQTLSSMILLLLAWGSWPADAANRALSPLEYRAAFQSPGTRAIPLFVHLSESFSMAAWKPNAGSDTYKKGKQALDDQRWQDAADAFQKVVNRREKPTDAALYWLAHALNKLNRQTEALAALADLRAQFPKSGWVEDGQALEAEIRQAAGQKISPEVQSNDSLKMIALSGLMNADPKDAIPVIQRFLGSENSQELKKKALFVLGQLHSEEARDQITRIASGEEHPELQKEALSFLGVFHDAKSLQTLQSIYGKSQDADVKRQILKSLMVAGKKDPILAIIKKETDQKLRGEALHQLGLLNGFSELKRLYEGETTEEGKEQVLDAMFLGGNRDFFLDLAREEANPKLRTMAIQKLGLMGSCDQLGQLYSQLDTPELKANVLNAMFLSGGCDLLEKVATSETDPDLRLKAIHAIGLSGEKHQATLLEIYEKETQPNIKEAVLQALFLQGDPKPILALANQETDPHLKEVAIQKLGLTAACDQLGELYRKATSVDIKEKVLDAMFLANGCDLLVEVATKEGDPDLQSHAIHSLGLTGKKNGPTLVKIYQSNAPHSVKDAVLQSLFIQGNANALVSIARAEKDHQLKKSAIEKLSMMNSAEAKAFMLEILNQ